MPAPPDLFAAEAAILERLRANFPELAGVHPWAELEGVLADSGRRLPALFVVFGSHRIGDGSGVAARYDQTWHVVLAVPSRNDADGVRARAAAGAVLHKAARLLQYWRPLTGVSRLIAIDPPRARYGAGYALFPLSFRAATTIVSEDETP